MKAACRAEDWGRSSYRYCEFDDESLIAMDGDGGGRFRERPVPRLSLRDERGTGQSPTHRFAMNGAPRTVTGLVALDPEE